MSIENKQMIWISGCIDKIIYDNKKGFMIFVLRKKTNSIIVKGEFLQIPLKSSIRILGYYVRDKKYGKQFSAISYQFVIPENIYSWQKWLASGIIKGIRTKNARKIIDYFGEDTMNILNGQPEELAKVPGISLRQANIICDKFQEHTQNADILISLCNYGIPVHIGKKIIKKYGTKTIQQLQENPYKVADQVASLGFKTIDPIALRIGIDEKSDYRIQSAFLYLLNQAEKEGHVYLPENILLRNASNLLGFPVSFLKDSLLRSNLKRVEDQSEIYVYRPWKYKEEIDITHILVKLAGQRESDIKKQEETLLQQYSDTANEEQLNAVRQALRSSLMILTGGPGTGKTFTTNLVIRFLKNRGKKILLAAPTGRAAKRMEESTGMSSQTIHRLLEYGRDDIGNIGFQRNENNPLETDTVIIDESSMIDQSLMYALLKAIPKNCQLILVGDKNQLPSVGAGRILADIIAADICPVIELKKIYRQSEESYIAEAAHGILEGKVPYPWGKDKKIKDFYFIPVDYSDKEKAATVISEYAGKKVPAFAHNDVQVLTMTRVRATGCQELNEKIKEITNPSDRSKREYKNFREGDKVIQMKNNYKLERIYPDKKKSIGVFNGDTGKIIEINDNDENIIVRMDDESIVSYSYEDIEQVELAYAITVHKSQGSEYPVVLIPVFDFIPNLTDRQIIYTAITRAKEMVVLAGDYKKLQMMIRNIRSVKRYTRLEYLLKARS